MEGYFGNNNNFNHAVPPLNLINDNISPFASPRDYDPLARVHRYDESMMLRYLLSASPPPDENAIPRNRPMVISNNQLRRMSSGSSGGSSSARGSPLSPLDNLEIFPLRRSELPSSAVKIEEDVLVMDALPVRSVVRSGGVSRSRRMRSPLSISSNSAAVQSSSSLTSFSGLHKREICPSWEELGTCRYGTKCVFAHGKEEIDPGFVTRIKPEINMCISPSNATVMYGQKKFPLDKWKTKRDLKEKRSSTLCREGTIVSKEEEQKRARIPCSVKEQEWSPVDDWSEVALPYPAKNPATREAVNEYIDKILYGGWPWEKKRLPVFEEICPSNT